jgi:hypothetical protein
LIKLVCFLSLFEHLVKLGPRLIPGSDCKVRAKIDELERYRFDRFIVSTKH